MDLSFFVQMGWKSALIAGAVVGLILWKVIPTFAALHREVKGVPPSGPKWEAFGWHVQRVNGNDIDALVTAFHRVRELIDKHAGGGRGGGEREQAARGQEDDQVRRRRPQQRESEVLVLGGERRSRRQNR